MSSLSPLSLKRHIFIFFSKTTRPNLAQSILGGNEFNIDQMKDHSWFLREIIAKQWKNYFDGFLKNQKPQSWFQPSLTQNIFGDEALFFSQKGDNELRIFFFIVILYFSIQQKWRHLKSLPFAKSLRFLISLQMLILCKWSLYTN